MNTYEYIMERKRMCDSFGSKCKGCPANFDGMFCCGVAAISTLDAKEQVAIVEKWSAEHPKKKKKTRQDVFLEHYPEASLDAYGVLRICPVDISAEYRDKVGECLLLYSDCRDCRADFWMAEVKEDK
nr:MAG TPA: Protein of unknown function (DUF3915) [Caudoviricetes sp.]